MQSHGSLRQRDIPSEPVGFYHRRRTRGGRVQYSVSFQSKSGHSSSSSFSEGNNTPSLLHNPPIPRLSQDFSSEGETIDSHTRIPRPDVSDVIGTLLGFDTCSALNADHKPTLAYHSAARTHRSRPGRNSSSEADTSSGGPPRMTPPSGVDSTTPRFFSNRARGSAASMSRSSSNSDNNAGRPRSPSRVFSFFGRRGRRSRANSDSSSNHISVGPSVPSYIRNNTGWENMPPPYDYSCPTTGIATAGAPYAISNIPAHIYVLQPQQSGHTGGLATPTGKPHGFPGQSTASPSVMQNPHGIQHAAGQVYAPIYQQGMQQGMAPPLVSIPTSGFSAPVESQTAVGAAASAASSENEPPTHPSTRNLRRVSAMSRRVRNPRDSEVVNSSERRASPRGRAPGQRVVRRRKSGNLDKVRQKHRHDENMADRMQNKHICTGCGRVRSRKFHDANPIRPGKKSIPNFCRKCRNAFLDEEGYDRDMVDDSDSDAISIKKKTPPKNWLPSETSFAASIDSMDSDYEDSDSEGTLLMDRSPIMSQHASTASSNIFETSKKFKDAFSAIAEGKARSRSRATKHVQLKKKRSDESETTSPQGYHPPTVESVIEPDEFRTRERSMPSGKVTFLSDSRGPKASTTSSQRTRRSRVGSTRHFSYPVDDNHYSDYSDYQQIDTTPRQAKFPMRSSGIERRSASDHHQHHGHHQSYSSSNKENHFDGDYFKPSFRPAKHDNKAFDSQHPVRRSYSGQKEHCQPRTPSSSTASEDMRASLPRVDENRDDMEDWLSGTRSTRSTSNRYHDKSQGSPYVDARSYNSGRYSDASNMPGTPLTARVVYSDENNDPFGDTNSSPKEPNSTVIPDYNFDLLSEVKVDWDSDDEQGNFEFKPPYYNGSNVNCDNNSGYDGYTNHNESIPGSPYLPVGRNGSPEFAGYAVTISSATNSAVNGSVVESDVSKRQVLGAMPNPVSNNTSVVKANGGNGDTSVVKTNRTSSLPGQVNKLRRRPSLEVIEYTHSNNENDSGSVVHHIGECEVMSNPNESECGLSGRLSTEAVVCQRLLM